jgi:hypothetical protein
MNKRIKKKKNKPIVKISNFNDCRVIVYVKKKFWNKRNEKGVEFWYKDEDYINLNYIKSKGFENILHVKSCKNVNITIKKNFRNRNRLVVI